MGDLIVPIALWNNVAPTHSITSIVLISDRVTLVTGAQNGMLAFWNLDLEKPKECCLSPRLVAIGHETAVTALAECGVDEKDAVVSASMDGTISIWDSHDGLCLSTAKNLLTFPPTILTPFPDRRHVGVAGSSPDIVIIDLLTLKAVSYIKGHFDWVTTLFAFDLGRNSPPLLMSGSKDGTIRYWSLTEGDEDLPIQTIVLPERMCGEILVVPLSVALSPDLITFLVVSSRSVSVFLASTTRLLWSVPCPYDIGWSSGVYIDCKRILVWTKSGVGCVYKVKLPKNELIPPISFLGSLFDLPSSTYTAQSISMDDTSFPASPNPPSSPLVYASLSATPPHTTPKLGKFVEKYGEKFFTTIPESVSPFFNVKVQNLDPKTSAPSIVCTFNEALNNSKNAYFSYPVGGCWGNIFCVGDSDGKVCVWVLRDLDESVSISTNPHTVSYFSSAWSNVNSLDNHPSNDEKGKNPSRSNSDVAGSYGLVTATLIIEDLFLLVRGFDSGIISTSSLPTEPFPRMTRAHNSKITALLCSPISPQNSPLTSSQALHSSRRLLVSSAEDSTIKIFDLSNFELIHTFSNHSAPVISMFTPPVGKGNEMGGWVGGWDNTVFFSISEDKCVGLFSLEGLNCKHMFGAHSSQIVKVSWKPSQDYLIIECDDGSVDVWEMTTGEIEVTTWGAVAKDVSNSSELLWRNFKPVHNIHNHNLNLVTTPTPTPQLQKNVLSTTYTVPQGIKGFSIQNKGDSPIQLLTLNIHKIVNELHKNLRRGSAVLGYGSNTNHIVNNYNNGTENTPYQTPKIPNNNNNNTTTNNTTTSTPHIHNNNDEKHLYTLAGSPPSLQSNNNNQTNTNSANTTNTNTNNPNNNANNNNSTPLNATQSIPRRSASAVSLSSLGNSTSSKSLNTTFAHALPAYLVFSYLVPWGTDINSDSLCKKELMLRPPYPSDFAFGVQGAGGNISLLVPSYSGLGKWQTSSHMTAIITLAAVSIAKALLQLCDQKNASSQILSFYSVTLPELLKASYVDPSLTTLASYYLDSVEDVMFSARSLFVSTINRLSPTLRRNFAQTLSHQLWKPKINPAFLPILTPKNISSIPKSESFNGLSNLDNQISMNFLSASGSIVNDSKHGHNKDTNNHSTNNNNNNDNTPYDKGRDTSVLVLGIMGAEKPDSLDEKLAQKVTIELLKIIYKGLINSMTVCAVELLSRGFSTWRQHIKDIPRLLRGLLTLSLKGEPLGSAAGAALTHIGSMEPKQFITTMASEMDRDPLSAQPPSSAISAIGLLIKKEPASLLSILPRLVETVVRSLDPHTPLRELCMKVTTIVLYSMVQKYPMISFHNETQRLAVGTNENMINIYDLKTATRLHILEGHKAPVTAVCFSESGKLLASFSIVESTVRIWQTQTSFLSGMFGVQPQCIRTIPVSKSSPRNPTGQEGFIPFNILLESVKLQWASNTQLILVRGWEGSTSFQIDVGQ